MDNDKLFAVYAVCLTAAVLSLITATVATGIASLPSPFAFAEHLAMSFSFRAAYKSIGGFRWDDWSVFDSAAPAIAPEAEPSAA